MKKALLLLLIIASALITIQADAQQWIPYVKSENPTFFDIQNAFNQYCTDNDIVNGKRTIDGQVEKAPGWKQFKRWEWYWEQRVNMQGEFPKSTVIWDEWKKLQKQNTNKSNTKLNPTWIPRGPYDTAIAGLGRINCMAFHPTDTNTMWVGTPAGGLWKTTNGGSSWTPIGDDLPVMGVSSIIVNPINPNIMYIATGDGEGFGYALNAYGATNSGDSHSIGILKSTDGGSTWFNVLAATQQQGLQIRKIIINSNYPDTLYAVSSVGIYKTTDAGANWSIMKSGYFIDIAFKPNSSDTIYASTYGYSGAQLYISTDGNTFNQSTNLSGVSRITIAVSDETPNSIILLCAKSSSSSLEGIYKSFDVGNTWNKIYDGNTIGNNLLGGRDDGMSTSGQGWYDLTYIIDPLDSNICFLGGINTHKSTNAGYSWVVNTVWASGSINNTTGSPVVHADKHFFAYHPLNSNILYECNDGGIFKTTNDGASWQDITNGMQISQLYSISNAQTDTNAFTGGRQDNGSFASLNNVEIFLSEGDGMKTQVDYSSSNYLYTSMQNGMICKIISSTQAFTIISDSIPGNPIGAWLTPYQIDPAIPSTLIAGYKQVYKSIDRGDSWSQISNFSNINIRYLDVAPTNSNYIYIAYLSTIKATYNNGIGWQMITGNLPMTYNISSIKVDPFNENRLFVTKSGYTANEKVFFTTNKGINWTNISGTGLPNLPVNCIEIDKSSGDIYVGTDLGVYLFDSTTTTWSQYGTGLPNVVVTDLNIQYSASILRVGTYGRGVWETALNTQYTATLTASFSSNITSVCKNGCVNFIDNSVNNATSWSWSFPGATPASSNQKNPTNICYSDTGTYSVTLSVTNAVSNDIRTINNYIKVYDCTAIDESEKDDNIMIYPSPNNGTFNIKIEEIKSLKEIIVFDPLGKEIYSTEKQLHSYTIENIPSGIYVVTIVFDDYRYSRKVIVL